MLRERWGTFSVIDHKNAAGLVPEILLYDRLVLPVPPDDAEKARWKDKKWDPDGLDRRLKQLDDLAVRASWDLDRQKEFQSWMAKLKAAQWDAGEMAKERNEALPYQMTRMILAQNQANVIPAGSAAVLVAAYQSEADFRTHFTMERSEADTDRDQLAFLLSHRFAVPADTDPEKALAQAIELARKSDFRKKRRELYEWQEAVIRERIPPQAAVKEMDRMVEGYNKAVEEAVHKVYYRFAFTIAGIALSLVAAPLGAPLATAGALLTMVRFATFDRKPVIDAGENQPAAMFHADKKIAEWHSAGS